MALSQSFEWLSDALEAHTELGRLPARGTVRLALRRGGLDPETVTREEMLLVMEKILPAELKRRGIGDEVQLERLRQELSEMKLVEERPTDPTPEEVFRRVFG